MTTKSQTPVAVVGTTSWGTTLALIMARRGIDVRLLARSPLDAAGLREAGEHVGRLPGFAFPQSMRVTADWREGLDGVKAVVFAVPSHTMRDNVRIAASNFSGDPILITGAKGLEPDTFKRMSTIIEEELPETSGRYCVLSGPNLAREVVRDLPTSTVVASVDAAAAREAQALLNSPTFRVYTNADVVGTELGGALKNVIAIGAGISDGMELGNNAKAGFLTRGLAEMTRLGIAAGAQPATFSGNAGLGDLLATCYSDLSRNRRVGMALAKGMTLSQALDSLGGEVAEGVRTTPPALDMARFYGVEMPITELTHRVLFEGLPPKDALAALMARPPRPE